MSPSLKMRCGTALMAGVGGIMPSLSKLGSVFVTNPSTPLPEIGLYVGLFIFFFIGVTVCVGFQEWRLREAFVLGICGPALIINILSGVSEGGGVSGPRRIDVAPSIQKIGSLFIRRSYAQDNQEPKASGIEIRVPTGVRYSNSQLTINFGYAPEKSAEEARKFPIDVIYLGEDGRQIITLPVLNNCADRECPVILPIPEGASRVRFELEQHKTEFVIPSETFDYAVFKVIVHASWNDLLWTLGFSRNLKITDLDVAFEGLLLANDPAGRKPVGVVSGVTRGEANVTRIDGSLASLQVDDLIFLGDKLGTSAAGELQITFNDGTTFRLGSDSQMVIDKFVFDPNDATVFYSIVKGVFLFESGRSGLGDSIQIRTPSGTIGIRG